MELLLTVIVSLVVLSGLDAHMWPQRVQERRLFVAKLTEAERARRGRLARERARRRTQRIRAKLQRQQQEQQAAE